MFMGLDLAHSLLVFGAAFLGGFVKGAIGFAMPIVMISVLATFLPVPDALALMLLPMLVTNVHQALRWGALAAWRTALAFRWHIVALLAALAVSAALLRHIPAGWLLAGLGAPILVYALWQLTGQPMRLALHNRRRAEVVTGLIGGFYGGVAGIWGPPLIVLLLSLGTPKAEQVRTLGVVFLIGTVALMAAHGATGVFDARTAPLSALLVLPAVAGMAAGFALQDRLNMVQFRRWTLIMLALTGANLVRRAIEIGV